MPNETRILAEYVAGLDFASIPGDVVLRAKLLMLDFLGSAVRASVDAESTPSLFATIATLCLASEGPASVAGRREGYAPPVAALLNGALGHSLDFDDTHAESSLHPSAPVVSAALAAAELVGAGGRDILSAVVAGYEVCCRIGLALDPTAHYRRGFHPTATAGTFGAAAAAARILGLSASQVESAFGVAGSQAAGSLQFLENGAWNKRFQVGAAAMNGLIAAVLAWKGFRGSSEALEGRHGFLAGYSDKPDAQRVTAKLGSDYETLKIGVKPYPGCRYTHAAIDGLLALRAEHCFMTAQIDRVEIGLHQNGITLTATPEGAKRHPRSVVDAQFSMAFAAAVALSKGSFGWDDYGLLDDAEVHRLADRISVARSSIVERGSHPFGAAVKVAVRDAVFERMTSDPSGEPDRFPTEAMLHEKFMGLSAPVLGSQSEDIWQAFLAIDSAKGPEAARLLRMPAEASG